LSWDYGFAMGGERERRGFTVNESFSFGEEGGDSCCEVGWQLKGRVGSTMSVLAFMCWNQWIGMVGGWWFFSSFVFKETVMEERKWGRWGSDFG